MPYSPAALHESAAVAEPMPVSQGVPEASPMSPSLARQYQVIQTPARSVIRLHGEPFFVEHEAGSYYIRHERWSLIGAGDTLAAAYKDLLYEAEEIAPVYARTPLRELDAEGARLTKFLLRFV